MFLTYYVIYLVSRTFDHIWVEQARYKFLIIFIIYIYLAEFLKTYLDQNIRTESWQ